MISRPWMLTDQSVQQLNHMIPQGSTILPTKPQTRTPLESFRLVSTLEKTRLPLLSDVALHRAYKTVGMRPIDIRCFNCLNEEDYRHRRNWMHCGDLCPACPDNQQHRGSFCPRLCKLRNKKAFWKERADLGFADGFDGPTPGSGLVGWKRMGLWTEGASGEESAQSTPQVSSDASVSSVTTTPAKTPLLKFSSAATSIAHHPTLTLQLPGAASTRLSKSPKPSSKPIFSSSLAFLPSHTTVDLYEMQPEVIQSTPIPIQISSPTLRERNSIEASPRVERRAHSSSPTKGRNDKAHRERSALRQGPIPQGPRKQTETSRTWKAPRILAPRGPARCSWTSVKINQPKHTPVKPRPPTSQPPPFIKEGTEEGELIELDKSPLDKSYRDIMSCLEMQLTVDITEEDWEDLFKGDV